MTNKSNLDEVRELAARVDECIVRLHSLKEEITFKCHWRDSDGNLNGNLKDPNPEFAKYIGRIDRFHQCICDVFDSMLQDREEEKRRKGIANDIS